MKKLLSIGFLIFGILAITGCQKEKSNTIEWPIAKQSCIENNGKITTDELGIPICIFYENKWCSLESLENEECEWLHPEGGERINLVTDMCNEQGGQIQNFQEGGDNFDICSYDGESFCYLRDIADGSCKKGDIQFYDEEHQYDGENELDVYTIGEQLCIENDGSLADAYEGGEACLFPIGESCLISEIENGECYQIEDYD